MFSASVVQKPSAAARVYRQRNSPPPVPTADDAYTGYKTNPFEVDQGLPKFVCDSIIGPPSIVFVFWKI
jgi:hypothetical protein